MLLLAGVILFISYYQLYMLEFLVELREIKTPPGTPPSKDLHAATAGHESSSMPLCKHFSYCKREGGIAPPLCRHTPVHESGMR